MSAYVVAPLVVAGLILFFGLGSCLGCFETHQERETRQDLEDDALMKKEGETEAQKKERHAKRDAKRKIEKEKRQAEADRDQRERARRHQPAGFKQLPENALAPLKV